MYTHTHMCTKSYTIMCRLSHRLSGAPTCIIPPPEGSGEHPRRVTDSPPPFEALEGYNLMVIPSKLVHNVIMTMIGVAPAPEEPPAPSGRVPPD